MFADEACTPVQPVDPTVTQATCTNGEVTAPTIALATDAAGVTYVALLPVRTTPRWHDR